MEIITKYSVDTPIFFTSDSHFCHKNIITFCGRPFDTVEEMNQVLIDNWNKTVGPTDIVYHLGDFCFAGSAEWHHILSCLNGRIHLILGNHDEKNLRQGYMNLFESVSYQQHIVIGPDNFYLNHYPYLCYPGHHSHTYQLFGHIHSSPYLFEGIDAAKAKRILTPTQYDVGVDWNNFTPISYEEVIKKLKYQVDNKVNMYDNPN
jgi:calcineurin-like phosphoesterase family protein